MKSIIPRIGFFAVLVAVSAVSAHAQGATVFQDLADVPIVSKFNSLQSGVRVNRGDNSFNESVEIGDPDPRCLIIPGVPPDPSCPERVAVPQLNAGKKTRAISMPGPLRTHADGMFGRAYVNQQFTYLSSPWVVADVTFNYLDSGVFGGMNSAYMKNSMAETNRFAAEASMLKQLDFVPEVKEIVGSGYVQCMAQAGGGAMASDICLEDTATPSTLGFDVSGAGGVVPWFSLHPDHDPTDPQNALHLSDLLVRPALADGSTPADVALYKQSFVRLFGDKIFTLDSLGGPGTPKHLSVKQLPPTQRASELEREIHDNVWEVLHELLRGYCEYRIYLDATIGSPGYVLFPMLPDDFWNRVSFPPVPYNNGAFGPTPQDFITLTTSTLEFTPILAESLYSVFRKNQETALSAAGGSNLNCDVLRSGIGQPSYYPDLAAQPETKALEWRRVFDRLVKIIAAGKRNGIYLQALRWINRQTSTNADGDMLREHAYSLIRSVAGRDPIAEEERLSDVAREFIAKINSMRQAEVGKGGSSISGEYKQDSTMSITGTAGKGLAGR